MCVQVEKVLWKLEVCDCVVEYCEVFWDYVYGHVCVRLSWRCDGEKTYCKRKRTSVGVSTVMIPAVRDKTQSTATMALMQVQAGRVVVSQRNILLSKQAAAE